MAEGLLLSVAERILGKLGSFALQKIGLWRGVEDEIELQRTTVHSAKVGILDAEDRQARGDEPVKDWLGDLREVVYDAEDLLDDYSTEVLWRQVMTGNKATNEVSLFISSSNRLAYGPKMGHKIKAIRERRDAIMRVGTQYNFRQRPVDSSTFVMAKKKGQTHSFVLEIVVGREVDKDAIRQLLLLENSKIDITMISIIGMGGIGKTELAEENEKMAFDDLSGAPVSVLDAKRLPDIFLHESQNTIIAIE